MYVLIVILSSAITMQEFSNYTRCDEAATAITQKNRSAVVVCTPK